MTGGETGSVDGRSATRRSADLEIVVRGEGGEPLGAVVVDSTVRGRSRGGLRLADPVAVDDLRPLARAMTLKYGFLGLPQGGAKGAVRVDPEAPVEARRAALEAFARAAAPVIRSGLYLPDADVGTRNADARFVVQRAGVTPRRREWRGDRSGAWTATTVLAALAETADRTGVPLSGARVAIEGFGSVGSALAGLLADVGARVVAVSTSRGAVARETGLDVPDVLRAAAMKGSEFVLEYPAGRLEPAALLDLEVDYLCPCAVGTTIHASNAGSIRALAIVPGANAPVSTEAEATLHGRGVLCVPDFLANCGGVMGGTMEFAGVDDASIRTFAREDVGRRIGRILDRAAERGMTPRAIAEPIAAAAHAAVRRDADAGGPADAVMGWALGLHRRGALPGRLVGRMSLPWFRRALAEVG